MDLVSMNSLASRGNREQSYQLCKVAACGLWLGTKKKVLGPVSTLLQKETGLPSQALASSLLFPYPLFEAELLRLGDSSKETPEGRSLSLGDKAGLPRGA